MVTYYFHPKYTSKGKQLACVQHSACERARCEGCFAASDGN